SSHGAYKFSHKPDEAVLSIELVGRIREKLPKTPLVMHAASSVPRHWLDQINQFGGKNRPTWGVQYDEISHAIQLGVRKVNVDTDSRLAFTAAIRKALSDSPDSFDPREYLSAARATMQAEVAEHIREFGSADKAPAA